MILNDLEHPIIQAPLAGGPSTPELTAAVAAPGALASSPAATRRPPRFGPRSDSSDS